MLTTHAPHTALRGLCACESFLLCSTKVLRLIKFLRDDSHPDIPGLKGSNHNDFAWYRKSSPEPTSGHHRVPSSVPRDLWIAQSSREFPGPLSCIYATSCSLLCGTASFGFGKPCTADRLHYKVTDHPGFPRAEGFLVLGTVSTKVRKCQTSG